MPNFKTAAYAVALATLLSAGCAQEHKDPIDRAVDNTKDALDIRDHEKLKDAAESAGDAAKDAAAGVKDAAQDARQEIKKAATDPG